MTSKRDRLFKETMDTMLDYFAIPAAGGKGEGPMFTVTNNKAQPSLNGRTFIAGVAVARKDINRDQGIGIVEAVTTAGEENVIPQVVIHISPWVQDPRALGIEKCGPATNLTIPECLELFRLLNNFLLSWKMDKTFQDDTNMRKTIN